MLTQKEILNEVLTLPIAEQREIVEEVRRNIERTAEKDVEDEFRRELSIDERIAIAKNLSGALKPETGYTPMTKEEEREVIEEYLAEKYA